MEETLITLLTQSLVLEQAEDATLQAVTVYTHKPKGHDCFEYQVNWSEEFEAEADILFVVEGHSLPVHSPVLADSNFVQKYLRPSAQKEQIEVKDIFWDVPLEDVVGFLCLVYPDAKVSELQMGDSGVLAEARKLGCRNTVQYMEEFIALEGLS